MTTKQHPPGSAGRMHTGVHGDGSKCEACTEPRLIVLAWEALILPYCGFFSKPRESIQKGQRTFSGAVT